MSGLPWPLRALTLAVFVVLYYRYAKAALFAACRRAAHLLPFARRLDASERGSVLELAAAGASHVLVVAILVLVTGVGLAGFALGFDRPDLIALGAAIGVGEVALGSLLCRVLIEGVQATGRRRAVRAGRGPLVRAAAARGPGADGAAGTRTSPATAASAAGVDGGERTRQWL
ncbi:hypothetical protein, partial [Microbispora sp. ATCC PTA-5024]|uniref:hypothetical protein n=1 Tax=Microbispora sp. ATCC PTA-5024 TaxID=316330 RepID=UPI0018DCE489